MAKYHVFLKFLATEHCFGNNWRSTTFCGTRAHQARVPHFSIPPWHAGIEKVELNIGLVLELHGLKYCLHSTRAHEARVLSQYLIPPFPR